MPNGTITRDRRCLQSNGVGGQRGCANTAQQERRRGRDQAEPQEERS
jgi:hypothetical protein